MAQSPRWKVYGPDGTYQAATKEIEAAAVLAEFYGPGATIRHGHRHCVWIEGAEIQSAGESYDYVAQIATERARDEFTPKH